MAFVPAFPGAQGAGAATPGGRGGRVIEVTTLANHGPGSLREALTSAGPRTVVFRVGGTIDLCGEPIIVREPYLTIAGQTAPGGGILIRGHELRLATHDVIMRYLRIRPGFNPAFQMFESSGIDLVDGAYNIMIDHCSISWAQDKNIRIWTSRAPVVLHSVTISHCLIAEGLIASTFGGEKNWSNALIAGSGVDPGPMRGFSMHHNLMMHQTHRMPMLKNADGQIINNLIYNWMWYATGIQQGIHVDIVGNIYRHGPALPHGPAEHAVIRLPVIHYIGEDWQPIRGAASSDGVPGAPSIYIKGNISPQQSDETGDNWDSITQVLLTPDQPTQVLHHPPDRRCERQFPLDYGPFPVVAEPARQAEARILAEVGASQRLLANGAWVAARDAVDLRLLHEYRIGAGRIPLTEDDVGGYPLIADGVAPLDSDHDGMPDEWELLHGLNPHDPSDAQQDLNGDGYTNLESYLYGLDPRARYG